MKLERANLGGHGRWRGGRIPGFGLFRRTRPDEYDDDQPGGNEECDRGLHDLYSNSLQQGIEDASLVLDRLAPTPNRVQSMCSRFPPPTGPVGCQGRPLRQGG